MPEQQFIPTSATFQACIDGQHWVCGECTFNPDLTRSDCDCPCHAAYRARAARDARMRSASAELYEVVTSLMKAYGASDGRNGNSGECWDKARAVVARIDQTDND